MRWVIVAWLGAASLLPSSSLAQDGERWSALTAPERAPDLEWNPAWPKFRHWEYVLTIGLLAATPSLGALDGPPVPRWRGGILFDDFADEHFVLGDRDDRARVAEVSDYVWYATQAFPLIIDAVLTAGIIRQHYEVALQLALIDVQAMLITGFVSRMLHVFVGRDRPSAARCETEPEYDSFCSSSRGRNAGFYSGHTALAFTGAGLTCAHHTMLPLWGGGAADAAACVGTLLAATSVGVMRQLSNRHYLSDIIIGAGAGFAIGYGLPMLLHFNEDDDYPEWANEEDEEEDGEVFPEHPPGMFLVHPYFAEDEMGARAVGVF
jgi:membrane-associated phospholipid phosphatase